jgi:5-methylcytosine-specific restriction endonuclease McrA
MALLNVATKKKVMQRANYICEYCGALSSYSVQPFVIEHIIPSSRNGTDDLENLAYACGGCNGCKYNKTQAIDPITNENGCITNLPPMQPCCL